ncbi:MAG TPA: GspH/FimT family pseudopilin [Rhodanobacteraceae bacterium]|nr:GspH/FimT family pseudopilin [Rhodanobacteraceae bacterium]
MTQRQFSVAGRAERGFTLVELMITVLIAAILLMIAAPSFKRLMSRTDVGQASNEMLADLALARTQAATLGRTVCVVANGGDWNDGWQVIADMDRSGVCDDTGAAAHLRSHAALGSGFTVSSGATTEVAYRATGSLKGASDVDIKFCRKADSEAQRVLVKVRASGSAAAYRDNSANGPNC